MKEFMGEDFLLKTETAKKLYHEHAEKMPIYDYHCHLPVKEIYEDRVFTSITDLWIIDGHAGDHYKWRALRGNGVDEKYITGDGDKKDKFIKWAETIPYTIGNPLYHWTHLELRNSFGITEQLSGENAERMYDTLNEKLKTLSVRKLISMSNVDTLCTTDDPIDDLRYHKALALDKTFKTHVYPSFRPDKVLNADFSTFKDYMDQFSKVVGYPIDDLEKLKKALKERVEFFDSVGCRVSDHGLEECVYEDATEEEVDAIYKKALRGETLTLSDRGKYKGFILIYLGRLYHKLGWAQQYHIKALRNNNGRMFKLVGPDTGFDSINDGHFIGALSKILNGMEVTDELPKTILYSLNPGDNEVLATLAYCFQKDIPGKIQLGSGWWFLDQKDGMQKQMTALSNLGLLSRFVGMLTDSRSFLSYARHEYFRRVLCNYIGDLVENGEYPDNEAFLGKVVEDICFNNAKYYFDKNTK